MRLFDKDTHGLGLVNPHTEPGTRSAADTRPLGLTGAMARRTEVQAARAADDKHIAVRNFADPRFLVRGASAKIEVLLDQAHSAALQRA